MKRLDTVMHVLSTSQQAMDYEEIAVELAEQGYLGEFWVMPCK
jgi:hypothetical protein